MLFAELDYFLVDVDGSAEGVAPAASKPKWNQSFLLIFFHHFLQPREVQPIVTLLGNVDVGYCPLVVDILHCQAALRADVASSAVVSN